MVENVYERRPRRKMLRDPVTGDINSNPKQTKQSRQSKQVKKSREKDSGTTGKIAKQDKYSDLRPLNKFHSKLLGSTSRLSVLSPWVCGVMVA
jgi:hypothetical protein